MKLLRYYFIPLLLCLLCLRTTAQTRTNLDARFSVVFPTVPDTSSMNGAHIWQSYSDSSETPTGICIAVRLDAKKLDIKPAEIQSDPQLLNAFLDGMLKQLPGMKIISKKPFKVNGISGYDLRLVKEGTDEKIPYKRMFLKLFFRKDVIYTMNVNLVDDTEISEEQLPFLQSFEIH
jgi:hypothetical protein